MKPIGRLLLAVLLVTIVALVTNRAPAADETARVVAVGFSPSAQCTDIVTKLIGGAKHEIRMLAYGFTSEPVIAALDDAETRGVDVEAVLDRSNLTAKHSGRLDIEHHHVPTWIDSAHPIAHNKVIIVDRHLVETGSFNFTVQGARNGENCIVLDSRELAAQYRANWQSHQSHSKKEPGR